MCGILAASGKINPDYLRVLGCLNASRGTDSAGIAWVDGSDVKNHKMIGHPVTLFNLNLADSIQMASKSHAVIGHTRAATRGSVINDNAHPFLIDGIVFAHNGVISNHEQFGDYAVDSQSLIHGIRKRDFSEYVGSIALVWLAGGKLFAYRNGNPLFRGIKEEGLYIASEKEFLEEIGCIRITELAEGHIYEFSDTLVSSCKQAPKNETYRTVVSKGIEYWRDRELYADAPDYYLPEKRPGKKWKCTCSHKGKAHSRQAGTTGKWGCWAQLKNGGTCPCSAFTKSGKKPRKDIAVSNFSNSKDWEIKCACGHAVRTHAWRAGGQSCDIPACPCKHFVASAATMDIENYDDIGWRHLPFESLCDCLHELEYHNRRGDNECGVAGCNCSTFFPKDDALLTAV